MKPLKESTRERYYQAALRHVNKCREILGKKPLDKLKRGTPGSGEGCVIARSIGGVHTYGRQQALPLRLPDGTPARVKGSRDVERFIAAFDALRMPELVRRG